MKASAAAPTDNLRGILFMCLAVSLFPVLNSSVKYLSDYYAFSEIIWARYAGHFLFIAIVFLPQRGAALFATRRIGLQITRSVLLFGATACYFIGLHFIAIPTAASISFTGPIIVTALAMPLLGEKVGARRWAAVVTGFLGALVIIRPGMESTHWASILIFGSASCYAFYQIFTRKIADTERADTTIAFTAIVGMTISSLGFFGQDWRIPENAWHWILLIGIGPVAGIGHYFVIKALMIAPVHVVSPFGYGQLIGATIFGYFVFGDFPDLWTWVGAGIIVASGLYITYRETVRKRGG